MCIICEMREAGASEEALELAAALADFAVTVANGLARLKTEEGALLTAEEELALLSGRALFEGDDKDEAAPEGVPGEVWASAPPQLRAIIKAAITNGGSVQVVSLSDMMPDESITRH